MVRTINISLPLLTIGLVAGFVRLRESGKAFDATMLAACVTWGVYAVFVALRATGTRAAYLALIGFGLVILARVVLAGSHF